MRTGLPLNLRRISPLRGRKSVGQRRMFSPYRRLGPSLLGDLVEQRYNWVALVGMHVLVVRFVSLA